MPKLELSYWGGVVFLVFQTMIAGFGIWVSYTVIYSNMVYELALPSAITVPMYLALLLSTAVILCVAAQTLKIFLPDNKLSHPERRT